jgi:death-on-curing protein
VNRYVTLAEYFWLAEQVTGTSATVLAKASRADLADSALHAPMAGFGDEDFYPDLHDKAAVLTCRLAWNHPLPDGKKRPCPS